MSKSSDKKSLIQLTCSFRQQYPLILQDFPVLIAVLHYLLTDNMLEGSYSRTRLTENSLLKRELLNFFGIREKACLQHSFLG